MAIPNSGGDSAPATARKRKRSSGSGSAVGSSASQWRTEGKQKRYAAKLLDALRRVRRGEELPRNRAVREAADRALAAAAHGQTRWSRAILTSRAAVKLKAARRRVPASAVARRKRSSAATARKKTPALERRAKVLGRLVPGCRKVSFPSLLEEATDYIAALQMQIRAMSALADVLAVAGSPPAADRPGSGSSEPV